MTPVRVEIIAVPFPISLPLPISTQLEDLISHPSFSLTFFPILILPDLTNRTLEEVLFMIGFLKYRL